jgi:hypothetical protein
MPRSIRFIQEEGALVEVTDRTVQARFLLVPSPQLNEILLGVLGLSSHLHLLVRVDDALQLSTFMGYFASNLAREIARLTGWTEKIWARRYQAITARHVDWVHREPNTIRREEAQATVLRLRSGDP